MECAQPVSDEKLNEVFDGDDVSDDDRSPILQFLSTLAREIAEETYSLMDCSMH